MVPRVLMKWIVNCEILRITANPKMKIWKENQPTWIWGIFVKFRIEIHSERIRFIPIHSEICFRANPNSFESIRKKFSISCDVIRLKIKTSQSESIQDF